jgi:hypothetical protein
MGEDERSRLGDWVFVWQARDVGGLKVKLNRDTDAFLLVFGTTTSLELVQLLALLFCGTPNCMVACSQDP